MEKITLIAEKRDNVGKGAARQMRRAGTIPAVLYRKGKAESIKIDYKELTRFLKTTAGQQVIVNLKFPDGDRLALMKDYQLDPVNGQFLHTDFYEVSLTEKIRATVHILTVGEPLGVKIDGGILQHGLREIEIECLPDRMPGHIKIDVSGLSTGQSLHVKDLTVDKDIKILTDLTELIATVTAPAVEKVEVAAEEVPAAAAAAPAEPEVIKKGKKEEVPEEKS